MVWYEVEIIYALVLCGRVEVQINLACLSTYYSYIKFTH